MTLTQFIAAFQYKADGIDSWRIINDDPMGDCDDFAITAAYIISGSLVRMWFNIVTFRMVFLRVHTGTEAHIVLRYKGRYIDNISPAWRDERGYWLIFPWVVIPPVVALKILIGKIFNNG